ncbi:hypothetical protein MMC20_002260 [Loxospora ochrophaea]|nr:hypothetical protein [Loxospora ochrophaea]
MPSIEREDPTMDSKFPNTTSLKAHKSLPKRRIASKNTRLSPDIQSGSGSPNGEKVHSMTDLERQIQSWIPEPPSLAIVTNQLPLTPPALNRDDEDTRVPQVSSSQDHAGMINHPSRSSGIATPANHHSPPTPEDTPPRRLNERHTLTPPPISRTISSRADSFKTALENLSSEDVALRRPLLSIESQEQHVFNGPNSKIRDVGLGLGLEPEDSRLPVQEPLLPPQDKSEFLAFSGAWGNAKNEVNGELPVTHERLSGRTSSDTTASKHFTEPRSSLNFGDELSLPLRRGPSLRVRIQKSNNSPPRASTERFAEQIEWPMDDDNATSTRLRDIDNRRLSQASGTSTIIEAMVLDSPPQRRRTLRHTKKEGSLRAASSPTSGSNRSSLVSNDLSHRLVHRNTKLPDRANRASIGSDTSTSVGSGLGRSRPERIPVVVIPERRSSLKSSSSDSKRNSRNLSLNSTRRQPSRPTTAPEDGVDFFGSKGRDRRTMSDSLPKPVLFRPERRKGPESSPKIPTRSSSLSAPTSRNVSRTTSLTSASLRNHNTQLEQSPQEQDHQQLPIQRPSPPEITKSQTPPTIELPDDQSPPNPSHDPSTPNPESLHPPRSSLVTPFSIASGLSSTPGTFEVSEATAINIYPHNNHSILIVQQLPISNHNSSHPSERTAVLAENANISLTTPPTPSYLTVSPTPSDLPTAINQTLPLAPSPLRTPRDPPILPAVALIPPTPANDPDQHPCPTNINTSSRPTSSSSATPSIRHRVKRALSTPRRYSESFIAPLIRSLTLGRTIRRPSVADDSADNALHPFWRPSGFWNDLEDSDEEEFGDEDFATGSGGGGGGGGGAAHSSLEKKIRSGRSSVLVRPFGGTVGAAGTGSVGRRWGSLKLRKGEPGGSEEGAQQKHRKGVSDVGIVGAGRLFRRRRRRSSWGGEGGSEGFEYAFVRPGMVVGGVDDHRGAGAEAPVDKGRDEGSAVAVDGDEVPRFGYRVQFLGGLGERFEKRRSSSRKEEARERLRGDWGLSEGVSWEGKGYEAIGARENGGF